jgi:hypothetical protein
MNRFESTPTHAEEHAEAGRNRESFSSMQHRPAVLNAQARMVELEVENSRLQRLVAELLLKNQKLREAD